MKQKIKQQESLTSIAIKNTFWNFLFTIINRGGALIFTILVARILQPELFGIYNLALAVTWILITFADLGINSALIRYVSDALGKNNKRAAHSYFTYLLKFKFFVTLTLSLFLIIFSKFISMSVFNKPTLFYPLIFSGAYLFILSFTSFFEQTFFSLKKVKYATFKEIILQSFRIGFVLLLVYIFAESKVIGVISSLIIATFLSSIFLFVSLRKKYSFLFKEKKIKIDKQRVLRYIGFLAIGSVTWVFFAYIDTIMLGIFIPEASYVGFYRAAFAIALSITGLLTLTNVFFPIFTQLKGKRFERGFQKVFKYSAILSFPAAFGLAIISKPFINLIYGPNYLQAAIPLYVLSFMIIEGSTGFLYNTAFQAKEKPKTLMKVMLIATIMNVLLNYVLIKNLLAISPIYALLGAASATILSRYFAFITLIIIARKKLNLKIPSLLITKPLIAALIMAILLILFKDAMKLIWPLSIIEILFAATVYFAILWIIKGIEKKDFNALIFLKR